MIVSRTSTFTYMSINFFTLVHIIDIIIDIEKQSRPAKYVLTVYSTSYNVLLQITCYDYNTSNELCTCYKFSFGLLWMSTDQFTHTHQTISSAPAQSYYCCSAYGIWKNVEYSHESTNNKNWTNNKNNTCLFHGMCYI